MSSITYETSGATPPASIVRNKKSAIREILEGRKGSWIDNRQLPRLLDMVGLEMNQFTARVSDLRDEYIEEGLGIYSEQIDGEKGLWRYKLDVATPEYIRAYEERRDRAVGMVKVELTPEEISQVADCFKFVLTRYPTQPSSFHSAAAKFGVS